MTEYVKPDWKKYKKHILDATKSGQLTAYAKHDSTGAMVPIDPSYIQKMKEGKTYDRFMFKLHDLATRWELNTKDTLGILIKFEVPCFVNPRELDQKDNSSLVGSEDVCIFAEYVEALEKNKSIEKKNNINPILLKKGCIYGDHPQ